jgi:hypothetical protein
MPKIPKGVSINHSWKGCNRKKPYATYREAEQHLTEIIMRDPMAVFTLVTYYCEVCNNFHCGNNKDHVSLA